MRKCVVSQFVLRSACALVMSLEDLKRRAHVRQLLGIRRSTVLLLCYVIGYIVYLVAGGLVFAALEAPIEREIRDDLASSIHKFLKKYTCVEGNNSFGMFLMVDLR